MLPTKASLAIQTDALPTQTIELRDQNQPQIYSLLADTDNPNPTKKSRRKKSKKLEESMPVTINPQITRTSTGFTFTTQYHHSNSLSEPMPSSIATRILNDQRLPFRLCWDSNSYDANNNINSNPSPPITISVNPVSPVVYSNSIPGLITKSQLLEVNQPLDNTINERTVSISSLQQNQLLSTSIAPVKSKRRYSKRQTLPTSVGQQQTSACPTTFGQPDVSNSLPSLIPASVIGISTESEEHSFPLEIQTASNYVPLTPPGSIKSVRSPPTNMIDELSLIPVQLPFPTTNVVKMSPIPNQYGPSQWLPYPRKMIADPSYPSYRFLPINPTQYCMIPSNLIAARIFPMPCSSILPETIVTKPEMFDESIRKSNITHRSNEGSATSKSLTSDILTHKKRRHRKDVRTKKQLSHIARQNRLAVLKFMIRKRKQQKQRTVSMPQFPNTQIPSECTAIPPAKPEEMKMNLLNILASSLKISFDPTQKIESIVLYYHRRHKPDRTSDHSFKLLNTTDNRLDLLVEAVDLLETQRNQLKLTS